MFKEECELYGASLILTDGLISDCARKVAELNHDKKYFDLSTLKEPYRLEGKKTMGYEIAETIKFEITRCDPLSHGRRNGTYWNVESIPGNATLGGSVTNYHA
jgi:threonine synthase